MLLIGDLGNKNLSEKLADHLETQLVYPDLHMFPDGEMRIRILTQVSGHDVYVLKSICPPVHHNLMEFCFIIDALKRNGANKVFGIVSYVGYSRADHIFRPGEGVPLEVVIGMIEKSGLDGITIIDPHSIKMPEVFTIPVNNLSALPLFAQKIKEIEKDPTSSRYTSGLRGARKNQVSIISPDMGGIRRIKILSEYLDGADYAVVEKERDLESGTIAAQKIEGKINKTCFVVDDIISTGGTIDACCEILKKEGAEHIYVFASHAVLSGDAVNVLQKPHVKKIFVTDTIEVPEEKKFDNLEILSVAEIIASNIKDFFKLS